MSEAKEKLKALQLTIDKLEKTYGKGTVMKLSDERVVDIPSFLPVRWGWTLPWVSVVFPAEG